MKIYYEQRDGRHSKFYVLELEELDLGNEVKLFLVRTRRGKIGHPGQLVLHGYSTFEQARKKLEMLKRAREKHGYQRLDSPSVEQLRLPLDQ